MNYRSITNLNLDIKKWIFELPKDLDLIVGIPRSGLLAANLLSLYLNLPFTDVEGLVNNRLLHTGCRYDNKLPHLLEKNNVLVVDDSICTGTSMKEARDKLEKAKLPHQIYYAAVYISREDHKCVDFWYEIVDIPRVFEWNVMHHSFLVNSCVDIDGVLCPDPIEKENDDGENYQHFLNNVRPLVIPTKTIGWLVTCRLEKYRTLTEEWLKKYNIKYNQLIMMDLPDKKTRLTLGSHALYKSNIYNNVNAELFIESSYDQAIDIVRYTGKPVLCTDTGEMLSQNKFININRLRNEIKNEQINNPIRIFRKLAGIMKREILSLKQTYLLSRKKRNIKKRTNGYF